MDEDVAISWCEDEACAELERIFPEPVLPMTGGLRTAPCGGVIAAQEMEQVPRSQSRGLVGRPVGIDQERERDAGLLAKQSGIVHVTEPDCSQGRPGLLEIALMLAQLRGVLAAEDSAVVPQEDNHGGVLVPQRSETDLLAPRLWQHDVREFLAERIRHSSYCIG